MVLFVFQYLEDIRNWMLNDKLKLNDDKTEFMIIGISQQLAKESINSLRVGTATITPVCLCLACCLDV